MPDDTPSGTGPAEEPRGLAALLRLEDYHAIWLGAFLLLLGLLLFLPSAPEAMREKIDAANAVIEAEQARAPFRTIERHRALAEKEALQARKGEVGEAVAELFGKPRGWKTNPVDSLYLSGSRARERAAAAKPAAEKAKAAEAGALAAAQSAQDEAAAAEFRDEARNEEARAKIAAWLDAKGKAAAAKRKAGPEPVNRLPWLALLGVACGF